MELINDYEKQYSTLIAEITSQIAQLAMGQGALKPSLVQNINSNFEEAKELLEQFGLEIRDSPSAASLTKRHLCYLAELKRLQEDYNQQRLNGIPESISIDEEMGFADQSQQRLLDNTERLERTGKHLKEGYKIVVETESIANETLRNLSDQKDTIKRARNRVRDTNSDLYSSNRIANSMIIRSIRQKAILYGIAIMFIIVILVFIYRAIST